MLLCHLFTACVCFTALLGDGLLEKINQEFFRALIDSSTHGLIGLLSWAATASHLGSKRYSFTGNRLADAAICGFIATAIDIDHFCAARSLSLKAAISLEKRPPLHCTSLWLFGLALTFLASSVLRLEWLAILSWMVALAALSHHVRDGTRRGIWLWPFGSTPALPYLLYVATVTALPTVTAYAIGTTKSYLTPSSHGSINFV